MGVSTTVQLHRGDCLEIMKGIPDGTVDITVTSPPYDNLRTYNGNIAQWSFEKFQGIARELYRVTKPGGVVVWVVGDATVNGSETGTSFRQALYFKEIGYNLHDTMIYEKSSQPRQSNRYEQQFEYMFILSKGKPRTFVPIRIPSKQAGRRFTRTCRDNNSDKLTRSTSTVAATKVKSNVWIYETGMSLSTKDKEAFGHPAIFPEALARDHIISWSNPGDTVLDPFMGSGTTGKMAVLTERNFIGIELDEKYFGIAEQRINDAEERKRTLIDWGV